MRAKLKVFSMLQSKAQGVSTAAHIKEAAGEKFSSLVCASHEIRASFVELSCGGSEWESELPLGSSRTYRLCLHLKYFHVSRKHPLTHPLNWILN